MDCGFLGLVLPAGEKKLLKAQFDEDMMETLHITQVALGPKPKPGPHVVMVEKGGHKFAIGTLDSSRCTQFSCDFALAMDEVELSHSGGSEVHLTGYRVEQMLGGSEDEDGYGFGSDESEEESEPEGESSEDEEAPDAVPLKGTAPKPVKPRARSLIDDEAEESSEEEEEEDEDMEDDEDEEESEEEAGRNGMFGGRMVRIVGDDEDSSEEEEESSGEEEESEEEPSPAPAANKKQQVLQQLAAKQQQQQQGSKRPAEAPAAAKTPQPAKKAKAEQLTAPATAPAKVAPAAAQAGPTNEKEYVAALKEALKAGPLKLAQLGTKVKRPPGVHKVKHVIDTNQNVFKYNKETDQVSLK
ncbi:histone deacetylase [Chlorella sorokiniana]|uniref:Histone deacetylase n=1 Tax=Chlorella sorokiniana TaxID=3076 RepID=A0A2P6TPE7_CHLSO|nr:histone deacetylase [Chlorella sorokiniana]|eukprot:PRW55901.1 histone deacetylase [Chlorella sorokiniana]